MKKGINAILFLILCISSTVLYAQERHSKWTPEEIVHQTSARDFTFSPDGTMVIWVKSRASSKKNRVVSDLYLTHLNDKEDGHYQTVRLTRTEDTDYNPIFSADSKTIYFLSSRDGGKDIWAMSLYGGSAHSVFTKNTSISALKRLGSDRLSFKASEGKSLYDIRTNKERDNTMDIEDSTHFKPSRIFAFDIANGQTRRLTDNRYPIGQYAVSKDGNWLVTSHIRSTHYRADSHPVPAYYLWNLKKGTKERILKKGFQTPGNFQFTDNSSGFYFTSVKSSDPQWSGAGISQLYYFSLSDKEPVKVNLRHDWGLGRGMIVSGNDVLVLLASGATDSLAYFKKQGGGWNKNIINSKNYAQHISPAAISPDGERLIYTYSTASTMPQYRIGAFNQQSLAKGDVLATLNESLRHKLIPQSEVFRWKGAKGDSVDGILYYPTNYQKGRRYPLVVSIHGGPSGVDMDRWFEDWEFFPILFAQQGAFVLKPNYHGSSNHGQEFVESIKGHYYEYEVPDIVKGVQKLVDKGMVDRDSLGIEGWSNGAILTIMTTIQHPDMFKAAAEGAGDVDWISDYGPTAFGVQFDQSYFLGAPWDNVDGKNYNPTYIKKSPLFDVEKLRTPTIIFQGGQDRAVTRDQSWEYYRAIQQVGKAPVKFMWFPGQPHHPQLTSQRLRKVREEISWFKKYLWANEETQNPAFKKDSPLGRLINREKAAKTGYYYGKMHKGSLIPEVVATDSSQIEIGRFEVTNQQYKAFDSNYKFNPTKANEPVTGITYQKARSYIQWLNDLTKQHYRLPNGKEAQMFNKIAQKVGSTENTLNRWAGYEITNDEARQLQSKLKAVKNDLLMHVGSFNVETVQGAEVYDIGGNAAEMYNNNGEKGVYGYSALGFVDPYAAPEPPDDDFVGFRVIKERK